MDTSYKPAGWHPFGSAKYMQQRSTEVYQHHVHSQQCSFGVLSDDVHESDVLDSRQRNVLEYSNGNSTSSGKGVSHRKPLHRADLRI